MITKKYADRWDAEIEIPFAVIGYKPEMGSVWGINICRNQPKGDIASAWSFTDGAYNKPNYTGWLIFK